MHLICFGDSICYGYGARPGEGWVAQMARLFASLPSPITVTNAGVSGHTTEDALRRLKWDVERHRPDAVYVQFGLNDASFWGRPVGAPLVELKAYLANMGEIVRRCLSCGARAVFLATNHPVASTLDIPGADLYRRNVRDYNENLRRVFFGLRGVEPVDMERHIIDQCPDPDTLLSADGVHLSRAGNDFYCTTIGKRILRGLAG